MSARRRIRGIPPRRSLAVAAALVVCLAAPAWSDDVPTAEEAVEKARALARQGHQSDAEAYLAELVREDNGPLAGDATVLLEAAWLSTSAEDSRTYAARAIERTRSSAMLEAAHMLIGDSYFAESLYVSASHEYEQAARHSSDRCAGPADLKRARSILASGDAGAAVEAYRAIVGSGATPGETTPFAEVGLATALLAAGRPEEAAEQFEATARVYAESEIRPQALAGAAESHDATGADSLAVVALKRLLSDHPDSYEAVLARERLRSYSFPDSTVLLGGTADTTALMTGTPVAPEQ
ncbi:MAG: tetratricopeptide repeat protein [Candidatus Eisenbacteria bacterium]